MKEEKKEVRLRGSTRSDEARDEGVERRESEREHGGRWRGEDETERRAEKTKGDDDGLTAEPWGGGSGG